MSGRLISVDGDSYNQTAVDFDWHPWKPAAGDLVRFLTLPEMIAKFGSKIFPRGEELHEVPTPPLGWNLRLNRCFGVGVVVSHIRPSLGEAVHVLEFDHKSEITGGLSGWNFCKGCFVPIEAMSFRAFVKKTIDNTMRASTS